MGISYFDVLHSARTMYTNRVPAETPEEAEAIARKKILSESGLESHVLVTEGVTLAEPEMDERIAMRKGSIVIERAGRRRVLKVTQEALATDVFIADRPHGDGRFDYLCGFEWCRCCQ